MSPKFSIVIPAYNAERWLEEAIDSVFAQSEQDWELIVIDDGSTDRTAAIATQYSEARLRLVSQPNSGQSAAQNCGLRESRGEFLLLLDSDDRLRPYALQYLHSALVHRPQCCLAYATGSYISEDGISLSGDMRVRLSRKPSGEVLGHILKRNFVSYTGAVLIRLKAIRQVGGLRTDLVMAQDWELWCRLAAVGEFAFAGHRVVLEYRMHQTSVARTKGAVADSQRGAIEAVFQNPEIRRRFPAQSLRRFERLRGAQASLFAAIELLRSGQQAEARAALRKALGADPFLIRASLLYWASLLPILPKWFWHRLGIDR